MAKEASLAGGALVAMRLAYRLVVGVLLLVGLALTTDLGQVLSGAWSFTKAARVDRGTYFRLKVDVTYEGEPQHFDIVAGCSALDIAYKDGSSTREVGLLPTVYGRRMKDGKGLVVRVPDACEGETSANGKVPADFMPVMVVFDHAERLDFGWAYISDDAYDGPLSQMRFGKATVEKATRAEFEAFRRDGPCNLVTREQYQSYQGNFHLKRLGLERTWPVFARHCWARTRFRTPAEAKATLAALQPPGKPRYWRAADAEGVHAAISSFTPFALQRDDGDKDGGNGRKGIASYVAQEVIGDTGVPRRGRTGMIGHTSSPPAFYPVSSALSPDHWPERPGADIQLPTTKLPITLSDTHVEDGRYRGFAFCSNEPNMVISREHEKFLAAPGNSVVAVDGQPMINPPVFVWSNLSAGIVFEATDYIFSGFDFWISSTRGDV